MLSCKPCPAGYSLQQVLSSKAAWSSYLKEPSEALATDTHPYPSLEHLLVFVGSSEQEMQAAAATAADLGFSRSMVLKGGLGAYSSAARKQVGRSLPREMQAAGSLHQQTCCLAGREQGTLPLGQQATLRAYSFRTDRWCQQHFVACKQVGLVRHLFYHAAGCTQGFWSQ